MSRSALQTVHLSDGSKVMLLDHTALEDGVFLYRVYEKGEILPKGVAPERKHVFRAKLNYPASRKDLPQTIELTRNEKGKYKQYTPQKAAGEKKKMKKSAEEDQAELNKLLARVKELEDKQAQLLKQKSQPVAAKRSKTLEEEEF